MKMILKVGDIAVESLKEQIDIETDRVESDLIDNTPQNTGGLKASLKRSSISERNRYGYRLPVSKWRTQAQLVWRLK